MISNLDYLYGWCAYLAGAALGFLVWWQMTRPIRVDGLREILRLLVFVVLFTPWYADPDQDVRRGGGAVGGEVLIGQAAQTAQEERVHLAPAMIIALLEAVFEGPAQAVRGLRPILFAAMAGLVLLLPMQLLRALLRRRRRRRLAAQEE